MAHRFKAILFDLDGTLIDSVDDLCTTANTILAGENRRPLTLDEMKACTGDGLKTMLDKAMRLTGAAADEGKIAELMPKFLTVYEGIVPNPSCIFPGILELLHLESLRGTKLAVVTNKHEAATHRLLSQLNLAKYFPAVVGGDTLSERKPHPLPLFHALKQMNIAIDDAVMVGDSPNDALAARDAGIPSIIMRYGYSANWPEGLKPDVYANHVDDCKIALQLL